MRAHAHVLTAPQRLGWSLHRHCTEHLCEQAHGALVSTRCEQAHGAVRCVQVQSHFRFLPEALNLTSLLPAAVRVL